MGKYDPLKAPNPVAWLAMDESDRIMVVERYHRREKISLPNHRVHAIGTVLSEHIYKIGTGGKFAGDPNAEYAKNLLVMAPEKYLRDA